MLVSGRVWRLCARPGPLRQRVGIRTTDPPPSALAGPSRWLDPPPDAGEPCLDLCATGGSFGQPVCLDRLLTGRLKHWRAKALASGTRRLPFDQTRLSVRKLSCARDLD